MATVYLARDLRHKRDVALKVLEPELAAVVGSERFLAEIETTAGLQHPHILPLFDSGEADGLLFYVMPYVAGESLRERLDREHQLPVDDAVRIATNLAEALGYAHRQGVVHRDIKPANVLLQDGKALISDFGIALAVSAGGGERITETGLSLGTPHYMSPEQATGDQAVGPATDIWALGCVLYEMLVGEPPYTGGTPQAVLGKIITADVPSVSAARRAVPANVDGTIAKALEKVAADRFDGSSEFARALADPGFRYGGSPDTLVGYGSGAWKRAAIAFAGLSVALLAFVVWLSMSYSGGRQRSQAGVERFVIPFDTGQEPGGYDRRYFTVSPDGSMLVYQGVDGRLWIRRLSDLEPSPIPGSENALYPSVSPDATRVAFSQDGQIRVVTIDGGAERTLVQGLWPRWESDAELLAATGEGLLRVPAAGGESVVVVPQRADEGAYVFVASVSDAVLFLVNRLGGWHLYVQRYGVEERRLLRSSVDQAQLLPDGRLLYKAGGTMYVDQFDEGVLELVGRPVNLLESVNYFLVTDGGRLVYTATQRAPGQFVWVTRSGAIQEVDPRWRVDLGGTNWGFELSRDDSRLAFQHAVDGNLDVWVKELPSGEPRRLTFHRGIDFLPRWGPDEASVTFTSNRDSLFSVWSVAADGTGQPRRLFAQIAVARGFWSPDGRWLVLRTTEGSEPAQAALAGEDIIGYRPGMDSVPVPLVASPDAEESLPALSPDGRWLAYRSNETGRREIFVRPFPEVDSARVQISSDGGGAPLWARSGSEIFYVEPETRDLISVTYEASAVFRVVRRERLFTVPDDVVILGAGNYYDVTADDQHFLMVREPEGSGTVNVVNNWVRELGARLSN